MSHTIQSSLEWAPIEAALLRQTSKLMYKRDLRSMIKNIQVNVTRLSQHEVDMRRGCSNNVTELLTKINYDIDMVEGYILVAALIGAA
jgi:hypothetical protein